MICINRNRQQQSYCASTATESPLPSQTGASCGSDQERLHHELRHGGQLIKEFRLIELEMKEIEFQSFHSLAPKRKLK